MKRVNGNTIVDSISTEPLRLSSVQWRNRTYQFRSPQTFKVEFTDGVWTFENTELSILAYSGSRDEAASEIAENLDDLYREIAEEEDQNLDGKAIELKRRLLELVEVETKH